MIIQIIVLFIIWAIIWGIYNYALVPRNLSTEGDPIKSGFLFIIGGLISSYVALGKIESTYLSLLLIPIATYFFQKSTGGRLFNSYFQILWFYSFYLLGLVDLGPLVAIFMIAHIPILFLDKIPIISRILILIAGTIGGLIFAVLFIYIPFPLSVIVAMLLHTLVYLLFRPIDQRHKLEIIN